MNKSLVYKILYYVSFAFTLGLVFFLTRLNEDLYFKENEVFYVKKRVIDFGNSLFRTCK